MYHLRLSYGGRSRDLVAPTPPPAAPGRLQPPPATPCHPLPPPSPIPTRIQSTWIASTHPGIGIKVNRSGAVPFECDLESGHGQGRPRPNCQLANVTHTRAGARIHTDTPTHRHTHTHRRNAPRGHHPSIGAAGWQGVGGRGNEVSRRNIFAYFLVIAEKKKGESFPCI